ILPILLQESLQLVFRLPQLRFYFPQPLFEEYTLRPCPRLTMPKIEVTDEPEQPIRNLLGQNRVRCGHGKGYRAHRVGGYVEGFREPLQRLVGIGSRLFERQDLREIALAYRPVLRDGILRIDSGGKYGAGLQETGVE